MDKSPYIIIKHRRVSEKANVLMGLKDASSNACLKRCKNPKYVFLVDMNANKLQIKAALEEIYRKKGIKVVSVNTLIGKAKPKRFRGRPGNTKPYKKAVVTLREGDCLDES